MYRRYSQVGDGNMPLSQVNRNRVKNIIILLLLAALAAMLVISIPLMQNRDSSHSMHVQMIQRECKSAYDDAKVLSRNAGADSAPYAAHVHIAKNAASTGKAKAAITTFAFTIFFPINVHSLGLYGSYYKPLLC